MQLETVNTGNYEGQMKSGKKHGFGKFKKSENC